MELGQRLKQARLDAGLSQRQLCGEEITRNMLSQIENGAARPSMDTLRYLAGRLGKPVGYFLEEDAVISPNQQVMEQLRAARGTEVLELLKQYKAPDPVFDRERYYLEARACLEAARESMDRPGYAMSLLDRCEIAGEKTPYYIPALERERLLLCFETGLVEAAGLESRLPADDRELFLQAQGALERGEPDTGIRILQAARHRSERWHNLMGRCAMAAKDYQQAVYHLEQVQDTSLQRYVALERCYKELEDYKKAYYYACLQRQQDK